MAVPFSEKLSIIISLVKKPKELNALISLKHSGYLNDIGWFNAFNLGESVGRKNEPLPWVTYPFIDFIRERVTKKMKVFEFGSGNSTLFYSKYSGSVIAVEHNLDWFNKISRKSPPNVKIIYQDVEENGDYCRSASGTGEKFDIIIIDAEDRINCIKQSLNPLQENGIIILDDSDRPEYIEAFSLLKDVGFKHIDFWGISPGYLNRKSTTVFYRKDNCLNI